MYMYVVCVDFATLCMYVCVCVCVIETFMCGVYMYVYCHTQDWLSASARKVALAKRPMEWVTPLGLPVVQPYHKPYKRNVRKLTLKCQMSDYM